MGDDQRRGGDSSWHRQQGAHYLWKHAGHLRVSPQVRILYSRDVETRIHVFGHEFIKFMKLVVPEQHLLEGTGEIRAASGGRRPLFCDLGTRCPAPYCLC